MRLLAHEGNDLITVSNHLLRAGQDFILRKLLYGEDLRFGGHRGRVSLSRAASALIPHRVLRLAHLHHHTELVALLIAVEPLQRQRRLFLVREGVLCTHESSWIRPSLAVLAASGRSAFDANAVAAGRTDTVCFLRVSLRGPVPHSDGVDAGSLPPVDLSLPIVDVRVIIAQIGVAAEGAQAALGSGIVGGRKSLLLFGRVV